MTRLDAIREVRTRDGKPQRVRNGRLHDPTGEIELVLWGDDVETVKEGDRVRVVEGWVADYRGRPQVSAGRSGRIERLPADPEGSASR